MVRSPMRASTRTPPGNEASITGMVRSFLEKKSAVEATPPHDAFGSEPERVADLVLPLTHLQVDLLLARGFERVDAVDGVRERVDECEVDGLPTRNEIAHSDGGMVLDHAGGEDVDD